MSVLRVSRFHTTPIPKQGSTAASISEMCHTVREPSKVHKTGCVALHNVIHSTLNSATTVEHSAWLEHSNLLISWCAPNRYESWWLVEQRCLRSIQFLNADKEVFLQWQLIILLVEDTLLVEGNICYVMQRNLNNSQLAGEAQRKTN